MKSRRKVVVADSDDDEPQFAPTSLLHLPQDIQTLILCKVQIVVLRATCGALKEQVEHAITPKLLRF